MDNNQQFQTMIIVNDLNDISGILNDEFAADLCLVPAHEHLRFVSACTAVWSIGATTDY